MTIPTLKKKLDKIFSEYIRKRDQGICFTCENKKEWKKQDCGHFIPRACTPLRWAEENCHCQCKKCNQHLAGNLKVYRNKLIMKYGSDFVEYLEQQRNKIQRLTKAELIAVIDYYKSKTKSIDQDSEEPPF